MRFRSLGQRQSEAPESPLRGLCHKNDWDKFQAMNPGVTIESRHGPIIHWTLR